MRFNVDKTTPLEIVNILFWREPLSGHGFGFARYVNFWMVPSQPANGMTYPQTVEALCTCNIRSLIEGAVACKDTSRSKYRCHFLERSKFIRHKMNGVTEESRINVLDKLREIGCITLDKFSIYGNTYLVHAFLGSAQWFC